MENGPDGSLYVLDLYHGIIQDACCLTNYLKDWVDQNGRIYRITHEDGAKREIVKLSDASAPELVGYLEHANGWYRDNAQRLIVVQQKADAVPALVELVESRKDPIARLHALWTLDGLKAVEPELVIAALNDPERAIRVAALRIAEQWLDDAGSPVTEAFIKIIGNTGNDWNVKYQLAASAGFLGDENRLDAILEIIEIYGHDYMVIDAALSGLRNDDLGTVLDRLLASETESVAIKNTLTTVATAALRNGDAALVAGLLDTMGSTDLSVWKRDAALLGAEVVLTGVKDPGNAPALPPSGAGSWSVGTLGDTHFAEFQAEMRKADQEQAAATAAVRTANAAPSNKAMKTDADGGISLALTAEPTAFLALGADPALADRVAAIASLVTWPGKPAE
jgi:hypothetical protein